MYRLPPDGVLLAGYSGMYWAPPREMYSAQVPRNVTCKRALIAHIALNEGIFLKGPTERP